MQSIDRSMTMASYRTSLNGRGSKSEQMQERSTPSALGTLFAKTSVDSSDLISSWDPSSFGFTSSTSSLDAILEHTSSPFEGMNGLSSISKYLQHGSLDFFSLSDASHTPSSFNFLNSLGLSSLGSLGINSVIGGGLASFVYRDAAMPEFSRSSNVISSPDFRDVLGQGSIEIEDGTPASIFRTISHSSDMTLPTVEEQTTDEPVVDRRTSRNTSPLPTAVVEGGGLFSCLRDSDILSGRGSGIYEYSGNVLMRQIVKNYADYYRSIPEAHRKEKTKVAKSIVTELQQKHGARFLKRQGKSWIIASDKFAQEKISRSLREDYGNTEKYRIKREQYKK